ncbi:MAG TPA: hypothetical protein VMZ27_16815 [Candidatus Saccharimonadales bacterium]|nr:hypothetical protein [Candidatus Saccharimonadales bacterium]
MKFQKLAGLVWMVAIAVMLSPSSLFACAACFGKSDSAMAKGMNMGIFSLLAVVICVLGGFAALIVHIARRGAAYAAEQQQFSETTKQS